jgi:hypothetical protein
VTEKKLVGLRDSPPETNFRKVVMPWKERVEFGVEDKDEIAPLLM